MSQVWGITFYEYSIGLREAPSKQSLTSEINFSPNVPSAAFDRTGSLAAALCYHTHPSGACFSQGSPAPGPQLEGKEKHPV